MARTPAWNNYATQKPEVSALCKRGHKLAGLNLYRKRGRNYCRTCRRIDRKARYISDAELVEREIAWQIDLPNIIDEADRKAR